MVQKCDEEFRANALKLAEEIGVSTASKRLGISTKNLYNWRRSERLKNGQPHGAYPGETPEQTIKRLLAENKELHEANDILRKALGFMAGR